MERPIFVLRFYTCNAYARQIEESAAYIYTFLSHLDPEHNQRRAYSDVSHTIRSDTWFDRKVAYVGSQKREPIETTDVKFPTNLVA